MFPTIALIVAMASLLSFKALLPYVDSHVEKPIVGHSMPLNDRYSNEFVNDVFKDNILLTLSYLRGATVLNQPVKWQQVEAPMQYSFALKPGEVFAFHDDILPQFQGKVVKTIPVHFAGQEGFKSDGYLFGDGVCHLASLMYWVARDAGLDALAPTNHDFAQIPDIDKRYGVAIYSDPFQSETGKLQNLYITNNKDKPIVFAFTYNGKDVSLEVKEIE